MNCPKLSDVKRLFALSGNKCAYPDCPAAIVDASGTLVGDIAHIKAAHPGGPRYDPSQSETARHAFSNLVLLCALHHRIVDDQPERFTVEILQAMKRHQEMTVQPKPANVDEAARRLRNSYSQIHAQDQAQVMIGSPGSVQAHNITIKTSAKRQAVPLPVDAIGANISMRSYIEYLNSRYIDYRNNAIRRGIDRRPFFPGTLHKLIMSRFGARTNLVPQERFEDVVELMQKAIDNTIWGRNSRARNYHSYEEHCARVQGTTNSRSGAEAMS